MVGKLDSKIKRQEILITLKNGDYMKYEVISCVTITKAGDGFDGGMAPYPYHYNNRQVPTVC